MTYRYTQDMRDIGMKDDDVVSLVAVIEEVRVGAAITPKHIDGTDTEMKILDLCAEHGLAASPRQVMTSNDIVISRYPHAIRRLHDGGMTLGDFLNYPRCCTDAYRQQISHTKDMPPTIKNAARYWSNAREALDNGSYPLALLFALHVPCAIDCAPSKKTALRIKESVERIDPILAQDYARQRLRCILTGGA